MAKKNQSNNSTIASKRLAAHLPWQTREEYLPFVCQHRISPEIYLSGRSLDDLTPIMVQDVASILSENGLVCTIHAPFDGMDPGSSDSFVRMSTRSSFLRILSIAEQLKPEVIVCHSGFNDRLHSTHEERWIDRSITFWKELLPDIIKADTCVALENVFEREPAILRRVIEGVRSLRVRHCFDVGHFNIMSAVSLDNWFSELGRYCVECHLHDNGGDSDEHLAIGDGNADFDGLFNLLGRYAPDSLLTLEAHSKEDLRRTYSAIQKWVQVS